MEVNVTRENVGKSPTIAVVGGSERQMLKDAINAISDSKDNVVIIRSEGKEIGVVVFDETIFKETEEEILEKRDKIIEEFEDLREPSEEEVKEEFKQDRLAQNRVDNKYNKFLQEKKNKQQFKAQKFNQRASSKFSGKHNINLRRGGGR